MYAMCAWAADGDGFALNAFSTFSKTSSSWKSSLFLSTEGSVEICAEYIAVNRSRFLWACAKTPAPLELESL